MLSIMRYAKGRQKSRKPSLLSRSQIRIQVLKLLPPESYGLPFTEPKDVILFGPETTRKNICKAYFLGCDVSKSRVEVYSVDGKLLSTINGDDSNEGKNPFIAIALEDDEYGSDNNSASEITVIPGSTTESESKRLWGHGSISYNKKLTEIRTYIIDERIFD